MKVATLLVIFFQVYTSLFAADSVLVYSPDKNISVTVHYKDKITYTIKYADEIILQPSLIDLILENSQRLSGDLKLQKKSKASHNEKIISPVPEKRKVIINNYNELTLQFRQPYTILFRVYNDGDDYKIITRFKDSVTVKNEVALFNFGENKNILLPIIEQRKDEDRFHTSFEELYQQKLIGSLSDSVIAY